MSSEKYTLERMKVLAEQVRGLFDTYIRTHSFPRGWDPELSAVLAFHKAAGGLLEATKELK